MFIIIIINISIIYLFLQCNIQNYFSIISAFPFVISRLRLWPCKHLFLSMWIVPWSSRRATEVLKNVWPQFKPYSCEDFWIWNQYDYSVKDRNVNSLQGPNLNTPFKFHLVQVFYVLDKFVALLLTMCIIVLTLEKRWFPRGFQQDQKCLGEPYYWYLPINIL